MTLSRRIFLSLATGTAALPAASRLALAQAYPARPVHLLVGFSAGSASDIIARLIAQKLSEQLGQPVVVENRPGAGTNIAAEESEPTLVAWLAGQRELAVEAAFALGDLASSRHKLREETLVALMNAAAGSAAAPVASDSKVRRDRYMFIPP